MNARHAIQPLVIIIAAAAALLAATHQPVIAQDEKQTRLTIELNDIEQQQTACRLTLLIENKLGAAITDLGLELVLFGPDQRIMKLIAVPAGAFPPSKTRIRQFDLAGIQCAGISRILLNTITRCEGAGMSPSHCLEAAKTRSRVKVDLQY
ncbi:MAG: Tat pathway signal sequence domain protein [Alphaproteobacteria bacterium]|nr:Tat pathway signal sequence domain protein [Alphaproteobacteria bacterium]